MFSQKFRYQLSLCPSLTRLFNHQGPKRKFKPPPESERILSDYRDVELPEVRRLRTIHKNPRTALNPSGIQIKMPKSTELIRGPEEICTDFLHGQYGIVAEGGGYLKSGHMDMIRLTILRRMDIRRMFAVWRVSDLWKTKTKKGVGKTLGGGKGNISYFTYPIKDKRVILEVGGQCSFEEVLPFLNIIANNLPFKARPMTQKMIEDKRENLKITAKMNTNPYTFEYLIRNNMQENSLWRKKYMDSLYYGRYI